MPRSAFCSAAGVTIASSQLKHIFGLAAMPRKKYWWQTISYIVTHLGDTQPSVRRERVLAESFLLLVSRSLLGFRLLVQTIILVETIDISCTLPNRFRFSLVRIT